MENRRDFIKKVSFGAAALSLPSVVNAATVEMAAAKIKIEPGMTILFQGDSITDAGRNKEAINKPNDRNALGTGYAYIAASKLLGGVCAGKEVKIYNRGISGNKVYQLQERWKKDCLDLKPDVLSILIGVNDFWHKLNGNYDGTVEIYERDYRKLLQDTKAALPNVKLIICEPFALVGTTAVNEKWFPEFDAYRIAAAKLAREFDALFIPLQSIFEKAAKRAPNAYWAADGVHPSIAGAEMIATEWMKTVK